MWISLAAFSTVQDEHGFWAPESMIYSFDYWQPNFQSSLFSHFNLQPVISLNLEGKEKKGLMKGMESTFIEYLPSAK